MCSFYLNLHIKIDNKKVAFDKEVFEIDNYLVVDKEFAVLQLIGELGVPKK
jgi:hypothetical protein